MRCHSVGKALIDPLVCCPRSGAQGETLNTSTPDGFFALQSNLLQGVDQRKISLQFCGYCNGILKYAVHIAVQVTVWLLGGTWVDLQGKDGQCGHLEGGAVLGGTHRGVLRAFFLLGSYGGVRKLVDAIEGELNGSGFLIALKNSHLVY